MGGEGLPQSQDLPATLAVAESRCTVKHEESVLQTKLGIETSWSETTPQGNYNYSSNYRLP